jgi:hypothetical protein
VYCLLIVGGCRVASCDQRWKQKITLGGAVAVPKVPLCDPFPIALFYDYRKRIRRCVHEQATPTRNDLHTTCKRKCVSIGLHRLRSA